MSDIIINLEITLKDAIKLNENNTDKKIYCMITKKYGFKLIINDSYLLAKKINADGCHLGQSDGSIENARNLLKRNKIEEQKEKLVKIITILGSSGLVLLFVIFIFL